MEMMTKQPVQSSARVAARLFPVLFDDGHYLAVYKPPRVNLESPAWKHGPRVIEVIAELAAKTSPEDARALLPLILPERLSSGLALFARTEESQRRFAGMASTNKLHFAHTALVRGKPPRPKIAVKNPALGKGAPAERRPAPLPPAWVEILHSHNDMHVARCNTTAAGFEDLRRIFKACGGLSIVGDVRPGPHADTRKANPARRPLVHLERLILPHPFHKGNLAIEAPTPRAFHSYLTAQVLLEEHLHAALAARLNLLLDPETDTYRLFTGRNEGLAGFVAERYGPAVVIETLAGKYQGDDATLRQAANFYGRMLDARTIYAKHIPKRRDDAAAAEKSLITLLKGPDIGEITVREKGVHYLVTPGDGLSVGLFLDQRDNRRRIAKLADGKKVLNLFAYTCGFSVAAAVGGAAGTTSVDQAVGMLEWGKRNFSANGLDLAGHVFIKSEVFEYFKRAKRQEKRFDVIILDPPSFARMKKPKRTFEVKRHLVELLAECLDLLNPEGHLLVSTNNRLLPLKWLIEQVEIAWEGVPYKVVAKPKLPQDFAPDSAYQKSILVRKLRE